MPTKTNKPLSFLSGFVQSYDVGRVIAQIDELTEQGSSRSWLMKWTRSDGKWTRFVVDWTATRMCVISNPELQVLTTGPNGNVSILTLQGNAEEMIDDTREGPTTRGPIRHLREIGNYVYACGMSRQVYRRESPRQWVRRDQGVLLPHGVVKVTGFNSIDGHDENDMYAVGYEGEIWRCVNEVWHQADSPTNVVLHCVRVINKDTVYAGGQKGVLLRGRGNDWEEIDQDITEDNLWGMEWFKGRLYVSSERAVYRLDENDELKRIDMGVLKTCGHLHANDGVMWSFGTKDLGWTEEGEVWNDVTP